MGIFTLTRTLTHKIPRPPMQVWVPATIFMGMGVGKKTHRYGYGCSVNAKKSLLVYLTQAHWHLWLVSDETLYLKGYS